MGTIEQVTLEELLRYLGSVGPTSKGLIQHLHAQNLLDQVITTLLKAGNANNKEEAISYIAKFAENLPKNGKINWGDMKKVKANSKNLKKLRKLATYEEEESVISDLTRSYGVYSHTAIPALLSGKLKSALEATSRKKHSEEQLFLFTNGNGSNCIDKKDSWSKVSGRIVRNWYKLSEQLEKNTFLLYTKDYQTLRYDLEKIFKGYMPKVLDHGFMQEEHLEYEYLSFLTFMIWAEAITFFQLSFGGGNENLNIFSEISVLPYDADFSAGRIDAIEVFKINGSRPSAIQQAILKNMTANKYASVGHLIKSLVKIFGENLEIRIYDWKFAVGDGTNGISSHLNIIEDGAVENQPLEEHKRQIERYISMSKLSYFLTEGGKAEEIGDIWRKGQLSIQGVLVYFLPTSLPKIHEISLNEEGMEKAFQEQIAQNYADAEHRAFLRKATNDLAKEIIGAIEGKNKATKVKPVRLQNQLELPDILSQVPINERVKVSQVVDHYHVRVFVDKYGIIEVVTNKKGEKKYQLHLDQLEDAMDNGHVKKPWDWTTKKGGKIHCLMPDHEDKNPSMHITPPRKSFKCFVCGAGGKISESSLPDHLKIMVQGVKPSQDSDILKLVIPKRHQEIMKKAQELLQKAFPGSPGERYLAKERGLNPEISFRLGVGYASTDLVFNLLQAGFNYDELLRYGFLGTSEKTRPDSHFVRQLLEYGLKLEEITKFEHEPQKGTEVLKKIPLLPYFALRGAGGRVTYPLEIDGIINNFYGRLTNNFGEKHLKLETKRNNMPHGAFNMTNAMAQASEILAVEAPINADTIIQNGDIGEAVTALVGVNNPVLSQILSGFSGNINIGLDYDKSEINEKTGKEMKLAGQRATIKLTRFLEESGFKGKIRDFTKMFIAKNPEFTVEVNDFNKYWTTYRKPISVLQTINT